MTMKWKIITGFAIMILLIATVAGIGHYSLSGSMTAFNNLQRLSGLSEHAEDMLLHQSRAISHIRQFRLSLEPK